MPSPAPTPSTPTDTGIQTLPTGARHIPPTARADGSLRKEIKIRPGYRPPEEVEVYKNRTAEAWKTRGSGGVPGADGLKEGSAEGEKSKAGGSAGKNKKRREARKRAKGGERDGDEEGGVEEGEGADENGDAEAKVPPLEKEDVVKAEEADPEAEREKQARALKKKLRQARELKEKKDSGEGLLPEQFAKVIKIQELIRQLEALGFDSDGARKAKDVR